MAKKFNFLRDVYDPVAKRLKPVMKPLTQALTEKGVEKIQSFKKGGVVKGKAGKPVLIKAHGGEHVLKKKQKEHILTELK